MPRVPDDECPRRPGPLGAGALYLRFLGER